MLSFGEFLKEMRTMFQGFSRPVLVVVHDLLEVVEVDDGRVHDGDVVARKAASDVADVFFALYGLLRVGVQN